MVRVGPYNLQLVPFVVHMTVVSLGSSAVCTDFICNTHKQTAGNYVNRSITRSLYSSVLQVVVYVGLTAVEKTGIHPFLVRQKIIKAPPGGSPGAAKNSSNVD